jgi:hypothetical protein
VTTFRRVSDSLPTGFQLPADALSAHPPYHPRGVGTPLGWNLGASTRRMSAACQSLQTSSGDAADALLVAK